MKSIFRPLILTAMAFAIATPLAAQEEPAPVPAPALAGPFAGGLS